MRKRGFTLIELMIVVAIIAIIAAVAIPGLLRSRIGSNEASAQGSLKSIVTGQEQFKSANCVDLNANGVGEYGFLEELGGLVNCRDDNAGSQAGAMYAASPYIPRTLGNTDTVDPNQTTAFDVATKAGYFIQCWLPEDAQPPGAGETTCPTAVDIPTAEAGYMVYAWPQSAGRSGVRVFVIDPSGQPYSMANNTPTYNGTGGIPPFDAALNTAGSWSSYIDEGAAGQSGAENWVPTG